jgi:hypothetical protein
MSMVEGSVVRCQLIHHVVQGVQENDRWPMKGRG